jgi:GrpB-like predicted nucleotidyltransferase (UPF0157 family)
LLINPKRALAAKDWPDMNAYSMAKSAVIKEIIAAAKSAYLAERT